MELTSVAMRLGDVANPGAATFGKPLDGVRVLALEQMQALPFATQLLGRLGADVVKVESPRGGDSARGSQPAISDPQGRSVGATFLRNNFSKRSITIDVKSAAGRDLVLRLAPRFDVFAENFRAGALDRMGLGYADIAAVHPGVVHLSVSGFGSSSASGQDESPYRDWPAYASVAEAMSGIYEFKREDGRPPMVAPVGGLADIASGLFGVIGVLAALRSRDATGRGQHIDVAMLDSMVSIADLVVNFWSLGLRNGEVGAVIMSGFEAADGWFILQVGREHQFETLARVIDRPQWLTDSRFATRQGWVDHLEDEIRPAIDAWAAGMTKVEAAARLSAAGLAAGPCLRDDEVVVDPHLHGRHMIVEMPRDDGVDQPVLVPGNPVKFSAVAEGPERRVPWLGEHTDEVLAAELGLSPPELADLRAAGVVN